VEGELRVSEVGSQEIVVAVDWPFDLETDEWMRWRATFGRDEWFRAIEELTNNGSMELATTAGSELSVKAHAAGQLQFTFRTTGEPMPRVFDVAADGIPRLLIPVA
jgi:hypothetical protein